MCCNYSPTTCGAGVEKSEMSDELANMSERFRRRLVTNREVCESWIRHTRPDVTDPAEIDKLARAFWKSTPAGDFDPIWRQALTHALLVKKNRS